MFAEVVGAESLYYSKIRNSFHSHETKILIG